MDFDWRKIITVEPGKRGGKPCIRGMRITVQDVLEYLAGGMSTEEILADFPYLTREDIQACLAYAAARCQDIKSDTTTLEDLNVIAKLVANAEE